MKSSKSSRKLCLLTFFTIVFRHASGFLQHAWACRPVLHSHTLRAEFHTFHAFFTSVKSRFFASQQTSSPQTIKKKGFIQRLSTQRTLQCITYVSQIDSDQYILKSRRPEDSSRFIWDR